MATTISRRKPSSSSSFRSTFCCSFTHPPSSPDIIRSTKPPHSQKCNNSSSSVHSSPSNLRRILSPGRVSPIDSDPPRIPVLDSVNESSDPLPTLPPSDERQREREASSAVIIVAEIQEDDGSLDLRVRLKGKNGGVVVLDVDPGLLCESSAWFKNMVVGLKGKDEIEVEVEEDLDAWRETVEMMYARDEMSWLMKAGVWKSIDVLEVSSKIMFDRGITSCLSYIEAVPWSESEEEKLKSLFTRCLFDETVTKDILARLHPEGPSGSEGLAIQLIQSITHGNNSTARRELQSLVNGLLSKSSVYQKDPAGLNKESMYAICHSCLNSLVELFEVFEDEKHCKQRKTLVERVAKQVENINWVFEILVERHMAEDFVRVWGDQRELVGIHGRASPMVRYELSRVSACLFIALGKGRVRCPSEVRFAVLEAWFGPMMLDFGWLRRCSKGLDVRMLEEGLGQALLTLPLKQQQSLFVEWFRCFGRKGTECPNLSTAFQVWWRRSFVKAGEVRS